MNWAPQIIFGLNSKHIHILTFKFFSLSFSNGKMIQKYKYSSFSTHMPFLFSFLSIFIAGQMLIRCSNNHMVIIRETGITGRPIQILLKKCIFRNTRECNEFITSLQGMTGEKESKYNSSENLCLMFRSLYSREEGVDWRKLKSLVKKGATSAQMAQEYTPQEMPNTLPDEELFFEVPITWWHENTEIKENINKWTNICPNFWIKNYAFPCVIEKTINENVLLLEETMPFNMNQEEKIFVFSGKKEWLLSFQWKKPNFQRDFIRGKEIEYNSHKKMNS